MTDWFRSWHGAPTDPKWRTIARRAGVRPGDVTALVWVLLDRASQSSPRGSIAGYDIEVLADALGFEESEVSSIIQALHDKGVLTDDAFVSWDKHQPIREDDSAARAKAYRERMKREAEEAERNRTQANANDLQKRGEERREEEIQKEREGVALACANAAPVSEKQVLKARPLARDWLPSSETVEAAKALGLTDDDVDRGLTRFKNHYCDLTGSGSHRTDWNPALANWLSDDAAKRKPKSASGPAKVVPTIWVPEGSEAWAAITKARGKEPVKSHRKGNPGAYVQPHELQQESA